MSPNIENFALLKASTTNINALQLKILHDLSNKIQHAAAIRPEKNIMLIKEQESTFVVYKGNQRQLKELSQNSTCTKCFTTSSSRHYSLIERYTKPFNLQKTHISEHLIWFPNQWMSSIFELGTHCIQWVSMQRKRNQPINRSLNEPTTIETKFTIPFNIKPNECELWENKRGIFN